MRTLVTGSFAYDTILVFHGRFKDHILPDQVHILNVCFLTPEMRKEFGGCAGNISHNLKLLGGNPVPMGTVGEDFEPYYKWLSHNGLDLTHITKIESTYTAQAFVTTDTDNNQITAFHPGAMSYAHKNKVEDAQDISLGIVSPDGKEAMIEHSRQFFDAGIPFFFDPGQGLGMFRGEELIQFIKEANYVCVNDYEFKLLQNKTGLTPSRITEKIEALIITCGGGGADIYIDDRRIHIDPIKISSIQDPTGCGDAFRSGLLYGVVNGWNWETSGQLASLMGGIKIEHPGTQNHHPSKTDIANRFRVNFKKEISLG